IFVLIGVAFLTLLERKVLGYIQIRKGPNKVGIIGIPQPIADAINYPLGYELVSFGLALLFFLCCTSMGVYSMMLAGGLRAMAQTISYEVRIALTLLRFIILVAETNCTPFDFSEGESELVSGFNVEYRRGGFALIFMAEYSRILFIRILTILIFW
ncbi:NADH-ubiquinone oxidoreductase chain 1, partial [Gryllus bimaculatus]